MQTFKQYVTEAADSQMMSKFRNWIGNKLDNTNMTHGEMKSEFLKKYGSQYSKEFDQIVGDMID